MRSLIPLFALLLSPPEAQIKPSDDDPAVVLARG